MRAGAKQGGVSSVSALNLPRSVTHCLIGDGAGFPFVFSGVENAHDFHARHAPWFSCFFSVSTGPDHGVTAP
jgi:hypothetical protein